MTLRPTSAVRFLATLLAFAFVSLVAGCGTKKPEPTAAEKEQLRQQHLKDSQRERNAK